MKIYGISTSDIIMICSQKTLKSPESSFVSGLKTSGKVYDYSGGSGLGGVLCYEDGNAALKLMPKTAQKLFEQIKSGALYLK